MTKAEQKNSQNFAVLSAMLKAGMKPEPKLERDRIRAAPRGREGVAATPLLRCVRLVADLPAQGVPPAALLRR